MRMRSLIPSTFRDWRTVAILAAVYFVVEKFGVALVFGHSGAAPVWPPTGIALAALLVLGYRAWPGILLGVFLTSATGSGNMAISAGVAAGNTLEGLAGAWLTNRFAGGRKFFEQPANVLKFTVIVGIVSLISPPTGVVSPSLSSLAFWNNGFASLCAWWLADMLGVFVVAPLLAVWIENPRVRWSLRQAFEFTLLTGSLVLAAEAVFGRLAPDSAQGYLLPYLCLPFLIWAAFRFGSRETATLNFMLTVIAIWGTLHGYGLFARTVQEKALLACQGFIIFNSIVALAVAAVVSQRRRADEELHASFRYARSLLESSLDPLLTISPKGGIMDANKASELVTGLPREQLIGSNFSDHFTEPQKAETGYQKVLAEGQVRDYPLTIRHLSGRTTDVLYNATIYRNEAGAVQGVFAVARDITERKEAERRLDFTNSLLALFAQKASAKEYLDSAVDVIRRWSGCQALGIRIVDGNREIPYEASAGFEPGFLELENRLSLDRDNCCCIRAMTAAFDEQDRVLLTSGGSFHYDDNVAFINQLPPEKRPRYRGNCMKFGFASLAIIPLRYRDRIIGAIHLADRRPGYFPPAVVEFIESMSPLIGEAVHRFQTEAELSGTNLALQAEIAQRERAEEAHLEVLWRLADAEETERGRISRELHDRLGQDLTGLKLGLQLVRKQGPLAPQVQESVGKLEQLADGLMRDIHRLAWELHPAALDDLGLEAVLQHYTAEWSENNRVPVDFHSDGVETHRLPLQLEMTLYRITQEALTNVTRHANAKRVSVLLERRPDLVSLIVEDDGGGFDAGNQASAAQGKLGLLGMRERVTLAGGTLEIESTPGAGTTVFVRVPLKQKPADSLKP